MYDSLELMQKDLDDWLEYYNNQRSHSGRYCFGKTPGQTFADSKNLAQDKDLLNFFRQTANFKLSDKTEVGSAEEQPARDSLTDGKEKEGVSKGHPLFCAVMHMCR